MQAKDSQYFMYSIGHQGLEVCSIFHILQLYRARRITIKSQNAISMYLFHLKKYQRSVRDRYILNNFTVSNIDCKKLINWYSNTNLSMFRLFPFVPHQNTSQTTFNIFFTSFKKKQKKKKLKDNSNFWQLKIKKKFGCVNTNA